MVRIRRIRGAGSALLYWFRLMTGSPLSSPLSLMYGKNVWQNMLFLFFREQEVPGKLLTISHHSLSPLLAIDLNVQIHFNRLFGC